MDRAREWLRAGAMILLAVPLSVAAFVVMAWYLAMRLPDDNPDEVDDGRP